MAVQTKLQVRRDTAANWTSTNPTLASGEIGFETDTLKFKIGNGSTVWTSLGYQAAVFNGGTITNALTVSNTSGIDTTGNVTGNVIISTNNGNGTNFKVGDDVWLGDFNTANSLRIKGQQNTANAYIVFGDSDATALGRAGTGNLTYGGNTVWHAGNDGSGSGLDADTVDGYNTNTASQANTVVVRDASQNFAANTITAKLFGTANLATYIVGGAAGSIPYQNAANSTTFLAGATGTNSFLIYASGAPFWSTPTSSMAYLSGFSQYTTAAGVTSLDNTSSYYVQFTGSNTQTVVLPNTATLRAGWTFHIVNNSTGNVTANTFSNTATLLTIPAGTTAMVTCINALSNTSTGWEFGLTDFSTYTGSSAVVMNTSPTLATPRLANSTTTATAGLLDFDGTVFYSTINTTSGKSLDVASYYYVSSAQYVIDSTSASLPLSLLGASGTGITVAAGTTYEYEGLFVISASFVVTSQTPTINLISTTVSGSPVLAHQTVVESGNNATGLGSASTLSAYRFTSTGIALTALTTGNRYYTVKMRGRIAVTGTGTIEIYPSIRFSAGSVDNAWIVEPGSIFKMTPIGNGTVTTVGTWA